MPRKVGLELMANTRDRTFLMFSLSLSLSLSSPLAFPLTTTSVTAFLHLVLRQLQGIIALRCCSQLTHAHERVDTDTRSLSIRLSSLPSLPSLSASAHARMDASEAVLAAKHGPASVCPFTDARRSLAALCDRIFRAASVLCPSE